MGVRKVKRSQDHEVPRIAKPIQETLVALKCNAIFFPLYSVYVAVRHWKLHMKKSRVAEVIWLRNSSSHNQIVWKPGAYHRSVSY